MDSARYNSEDSEESATDGEVFVSSGGKRRRLTASPDSGCDPPRRSRQLCHSKNAQLARQNRIRKKMYLNTIEKRVDDLKSENKKVRSVIKTQAGYITELQSEIRYLRAVLANSKEIGSLVRKLTSVGNLETALPATPSYEISPSASPFGLVGECPTEEDLFDTLSGLKPLVDDQILSPDLSDHNYTAQFQSSYDEDDSGKEVGICLHVSNKKMSLEFCSICNERAVKNHDFVGY